MIAKERVLDLGIGGGGSNLLDDGDNSLRVGADIKFDALQFTKVFRLENQTMLDARDNLPFSPGSFDRVQIFFPDQGLLEAVTNAKKGGRNGIKPIWPELKRILKGLGTVELYLDEFKLLPFSTATADHNRERNLIWRPHAKARAAARQHGFSVEVKRLSEKAMLDLNSSTAGLLSEYSNLWIVRATNTVTKL